MSEIKITVFRKVMSIGGICCLHLVGKKGGSKFLPNHSTKHSITPHKDYNLNTHRHKNLKLLITECKH